MNWVVIENTFVIIGASIPLVRPLFTRSKEHSLTAYGTNTAYEMNSRSQSNTKGAFSGPQHKSITLQSSSEENILPVLEGGPGLASNIESNDHFGAENDAEKGIKKEVTVQVRYGEDDEIKPPGSKRGFTKWPFTK